MLFVHIISTNDTKDFNHIYDAFECRDGTTILINPHKSLFKDAIKKEKDTIVLIGHGTEDGLLNKRLDGLILDREMLPMIKDKNIVGIWCNASTFASKYDLKGFFTSMFISNKEEFLECGLETFDGYESTIGRENRRFANHLNYHLLSGTPLKDLCRIMKEEADLLISNSIVRYNYEGLYSSEED